MHKKEEHKKDGKMKACAGMAMKEKMADGKKASKKKHKK
jgi:hypothetical protein